MSVPLTTQRVFAVARETCRQTVRERTAAVMVCLASAAIVLSVFLAPLALGEVERVVVDVGLALASITPVLVVTVCGCILLTHELARRMWVPLLATPVRRAEFLAGRALGLYVTGAVALVALTGVHIGTLAMVTGRGVWRVLPANLLTLGELGVMVATMTLFCAFSTPGLTAAFTGAAFLVGHAASDLLRGSTELGNAGGTIARIGYVLIPHLDMFNGRAAVVYNEGVSVAQLAAAGLYAVCYCTALMVLACLAFERREIA